MRRTNRSAPESSRITNGKKQREGENQRQELLQHRSKKECTSDYDADTQTQNTSHSKMSPPKDGHHGMTDFFIGDQTTEPQTCKEMPENGKGAKREGAAD